MHIFDQKVLALKEVINFFFNSGLCKFHKWVYLNFQVECSKSKIICFKLFFIFFELIGLDKDELQEWTGH